METAIKKLFDRYESCFGKALAGETGMEEVVALYATEMIGASPLGVRSGRNDAQFRQMMAQGYAHYRAIGTRGMRIRHLRLSAIDAYHCLAHVGWAATYARDDLPETTVEFEVHYLVQVLAGEAKVFGWVSGDEQAELRRHGII
ncbi:MAG: nuclear transport factor 2 family protein [Gemmobacter sp.]|jgi:hypothetical protein|nr:nuclear transport factor 2 family protein [Gemmobacter sp.]